MIYKVSFTSSNLSVAKQELLKLVLEKTGVDPRKIVEETENNKKRFIVFFNSSKKARLLNKRLKEVKLKGVKIKVSPLKNAEWRDKWKKTYKPFNLTKNIRIIPYWLKDTHKKETEVTVYIDPGLAFGSGLHSTTKFMAEFLELEKGRYKDFFDVGLGTGILSVIACKYGAKKVWGIDICKDSTRSARSNLKSNSCKAGYINTIDFKDLDKKEKFDFVAANLRTDILIEMRRKLLSHVRKGGYLAVSGISKDDYGFFRKKFDTSSLKCVRIKKDSKWSAILYKKI